MRAGDVVLLKVALTLPLTSALRQLCMAAAYACWRGARRPGWVRSTVALWYPVSSVFLERMSGVCMTVLWLWVGSNEYV